MYSDPDRASRSVAALATLRDQGILTQTERVHTKHHQVADPVQADAFLEAHEARLHWWLRLCRTARDQLDVDPAAPPTDPSHSGE